MKNFYCLDRNFDEIPPVINVRWFNGVDEIRVVCHKNYHGVRSFIWGMLAEKKLRKDKINMTKNDSHTTSVVNIAWGGV